jgi:hypothetical protein
MTRFRDTISKFLLPEPRYSDIRRRVVPAAKPTTDARYQGMLRLTAAQP